MADACSNLLFVMTDHRRKLADMHGPCRQWGLAHNDPAFA